MGSSAPGVVPVFRLLSSFIRCPGSILYVEGSEMEEGSSRDDIRRLLKTFGVKADEAILTHLARTPGQSPIRVRLVLQDLTDYGNAPPTASLKLEVEGEIRRG
jgi:hypothetical protein